MSDGTGEFLVPRQGDMPISSTRHYQSATITHLPSADGPVTEATGQFRIPRGLPSPPRPAEGVLLTHEQSWVLQGTALGPLLHSLCLAPGEITQVAVQSQSQRVLENSVDQGIQRDAISQRGDSESALSEQERASARDRTAGSTTAGSASFTTQIGAGGLIGFLGASGGSATTLSSAHQARVSTGHRSVSNEANQAVHQTAHEQARLARARHTTAVREVSEADSLEMQTRVVANYNHMHALTMQYYQVEQVYQLRTRVVRAERLLFVPLKPIDFSDPNQARRAITRFRDHLIAVAEDLGLRHVAAKLRAGRYSWTEPAARATLAAPSGLRIEDESAAETPQPSSDTEVAPKTPAARIADLQTQLNEAKLQARHQAAEVVNASQHELEARDALRKAGDVGLAERAKLQRALQAAMAVHRLARATLAEDRRRVADLAARLAVAENDLAQRELAAQIDETQMLSALHKRSLEVNQGLWLRLDASEVSALLGNLAYRGDRLKQTIDPTPVAVHGHFLGLRRRFADPDEDEHFQAAHVQHSHLEASITLPTGGVFGEAVLGKSNAAERIDLGRFWNWSDSLPPIRPAKIEPLQPEQQPPPQTPATAGVQETALQPRPISFPEVTSGIPSLAQHLANPELFRDMSGQETTAALAQSAMSLSAKGSVTAARLAGENYERFLQFQRQIAETLLELNRQQKPVDATMAGGALNAKTAAGEVPGARESDAEASREVPGDGASDFGGGDSGGDGAAPGDASGAAGEDGDGATSGAGDDTRGSAAAGGAAGRTSGGRAPFSVEFDGDEP